MRMLESFQLLQSGYFSQRGRRQTVRRQGHPNFLQSHDLARVQVFSFVHRAVSAISDQRQFLIRRILPDYRSLNLHVAVRLRPLVRTTGQLFLPAVLHLCDRLETGKVALLRGTCYVRRPLQTALFRAFQRFPADLERIGFRRAPRYHLNRVLRQRGGCRRTRQFLHALQLLRAQVMFLLGSSLDRGLGEFRFLGRRGG